MLPERIVNIIQLRIILICGKGVGMIRVYFDPISETVYIDIILNTIIDYLSAFSIFSNVREVNLVYPIHNGSYHKQQMINNDKLNHGKSQLRTLRMHEEIC
jgi:hypothetical protein